MGWDELGWEMGWEMGLVGMNWVGKWVGLGGDELGWDGLGWVGLG